MDFTISFQNEQVLYEHNIKCSVKEYEFNYTYNKSAIYSGSNGQVKEFVTGSEFTPYVTTIGLYNDAQELLAIAKFSQPIPLSQDSDTNYLVRWDG